MRDFWNNRYQAEAYAYGTEPNAFFADWLSRVGTPGRLLLPAEGEGRNAVHAAKLGWEVHAFDLSAAGRNKALRLAEDQGVELADYRVGDFAELSYPSDYFDALGLIFAHFPPDRKRAFNERLATSLKPGGYVIFEGFGEHHLPLRAANPRVGGPGVAEMLFSTAEVRDTLAGFDFLLLEEIEVDFEEGQYHRGRGSVVRAVARKPEA